MQHLRPRLRILLFSCIEEKKTQLSFFINVIYRDPYHFLSDILCLKSVAQLHVCFKSE